MRFIEKKVNDAVKIYFRNQSIIYQVKNRISRFYSISILFYASVLVFSYVFFIVRSIMMILSFPDFIWETCLTIVFVPLFIFFHIDYNNFYFTEDQIVRVRRFNALIKRKLKFDEIAYKNIKYIKLRKTDYGIRRLTIYQQDNMFSDLNNDDKKLKWKLELHEGNLNAFSIKFKPKQDTEISKKIINYLVQKTSLKMHPILKDVYFSRI